MNQMGALWTLRLMLQVQSGRTFNVGEYNVQIGAVTIVRGNPAAAGATAPPVSPGVVVAISRATEDEDEEGQNANDNSPLTEEEKREALEYSRDCMRAFFRTILENSGLSIPTSDIPAEFSHSIFDSSKANSWPEKEDLVRLWCRTLRLRG